MKPSKLRWIVMAACVLAPGAAMAGDSTWLVCKGTMTADDGSQAYLAVSVLEHRADDGEHRDLEVELLKGAHAWSAHINGKKAGDFSEKPVKLKVKQKKRVIFDGTAKLTFGNGQPATFDLAGKIDDTWGTSKRHAVKMTATLTCDELDDLAIGH